jgi:signal transduction histidine kinase
VIVFRREGRDGEQRVTYLPESIPGKPKAVLEFVESIQEQHSFIEASRLQIELATLGILLACGLAVHWLGARYVGRPIQQLRDRLRAIGDGNFDGTIALKQKDEIGDLSRDIDAMCRSLAEARRQLAAETEARMTALEHLRHTDRLTTIGQLAAGVAHELGTPLSVIAGRADMIVSGEVAGERATASARVIVEQASHMTAMIRQLLDFSRHRAPRLGLVSLRTICCRTVDTLAVVARGRAITIVPVLGDDPLLVSADEHQVQQALVNLLVNAMQATPNGGRIDVALGGRRRRPPGESASENDFVSLVVSDEGPGIAAEHIPRLFDPFFTTKEPGEGTGLGLSVAQGIVRDHGGWIEVESAIGRGSRFTIWLPAAAQAHSGPHRAA